MKRTVHANLTLELEITLVGNDNDREPVLVLDTENLLVEGSDLFKRVARGNGVNSQESLAGTHVLLTHSTGQYQ
jgi:hypothetical protein